MAISVHCSCGAKLSAPDSLVGKRARCRVCREVLVVPVPAVNAPEGDGVRQEHRERSPRRPAALPIPPTPLTGPADVEPPPAQALKGGTEAFPWEIPPSVLAKAAEYEARGDVVTYPCHCGEELNYVGRNNVFHAANAEAELRIYADMVATTGQAAAPWGMGRLLALPVMYLGLLLRFLGFALATMGFTGFLVTLPITIFVSVLFLPLYVGYVMLRIGYDYWERSRFPRIAQRILSDPQSTYAIRKLRRLAAGSPRAWQRGQVAEVVRVDVKRPFPPETRAAILIAQETPIPRRPNWKEAFTFLFARRRVYILWANEGEPAADEAARQMARALGVNVVRARLTLRDTLKVEHEDGNDATDRAPAPRALPSLQGCPTREAVDSPRALS